jgi:uncharacterized FAD-dependent dehydrogenase
MKYTKKIVIVGSGVSGISAALKLVDNNYPGELITIIDMGNDPYIRKPSEVMTGFAGAGGFSDGKLTYHTAIGGQLSKYCGEEKAYDLMDQSIEMWKRFHPDPSKIMYSDPQAEPEFIKPYFGLRLFPVYHIGTDYLHEIGKRWYDYLVDKGVKFMWETKVHDIAFEGDYLSYNDINSGKMINKTISYDTLIFAVGKSGIDFGKELAEQYVLPTEAKSVQIGVRFEAPQKYFQKLIDVSYDFKLYQKFDNVSLRSFCTNNNAAFVAVEETYGDISYNGHAKKGKEFENQMTNFGILMEIKGIEDPFTWSRNVVTKCNVKVSEFDYNAGLYYSPNLTRLPSNTSEGVKINSFQVTWNHLEKIKTAFGGYFEHIENFISNMNKVFEFGDDWGMYIPEVKYVSAEPLVNYNNLSLSKYTNVYFAGDALSARGITIAGSQGIYIAESILKQV